jgi:hypothetical protein
LRVAVGREVREAEGTGVRLGFRVAETITRLAVGCEVAAWLAVGDGQGVLEGVGLDLGKTAGKTTRPTPTSRPNDFVVSSTKLSVDI